MVRGKLRNIKQRECDSGKELRVKRKAVDEEGRKKNKVKYPTCFEGMR
jgi:hypothetical protein